MDLPELFSPLTRLPKSGPLVARGARTEHEGSQGSREFTRVEVVGRMEAVVQKRHAAPAGQLQQQVERVFMWLRPAGGQARARRNAWSAMVADSQRRQSRMLVAREIGPSDAAVSIVAAEALRAR